MLIATKEIEHQTMIVIKRNPFHGLINIACNLLIYTLLRYNAFPQIKNCFILNVAFQI